MTPGILADPSTRPLSEVARHLVIPEGIVDSVWFDLEERFEEWDITFDKWQDGAGQLLLGLRDDGKFATTVGGSTLSIARQVAKTFLVSRSAFGLCSLEDDQTWLWTAHRIRTATQTFQKLAGFAQSSRVRPFMAPGATNGIRSTNGEQELRFRNGSRILFGAREAGFGRGFDEVDGEVFDEGQILTEKALEDMVPAANQSRNPHGALLIFMGTPPRPVDPGEVFKSRRRKALALKSTGSVMVKAGNALYIEFSADPETGRPGGPALDDVEQVRKANPSYPHRTPQESIDRMRENLPSDEAWRREALGIWDDDNEGSRRWSYDFWNGERATRSVAVKGIRSFAVAYSQDGERVSVSGAVKHDDGVHVELIAAHSGDTSDGVESLADWLAERWREASMIAVVGAAGAALKQALRDRGVPEKVVRTMTTTDYFQANTMAEDALKSGSVTHPIGGEGDLLDASVAVCDAKKRGSSGQWGWVSTVPDGDETPVESFCAAYWAARTSTRVPGRKQVLL